MRVHHQYVPHRALIVGAVSVSLWVGTAIAGPLADNPDWKSCLDAGGTPRTCAIQVRGAGVPDSSPGTPRSFTPGSALTAAQENRVNQLIGGHGTVVSAYNTANTAYHTANSAYSYGTTAYNIANGAMWYGQDGRNRAINAQNRADQAASWTYYGSGASLVQPAWQCPPGLRNISDGFAICVR